MRRKVLSTRDGRTIMKMVVGFGIGVGIEVGRVRV